MRTDTLNIRTPEGIVFALPLAGPYTRFLAWSVDLFCIGLILSVLGAIFRLVGALSLDLAQALLVVSYFAVSIGYGMAAEWAWRGQTLGKRLLGLRVMDEQGLRLRPSQIAVRNLLRFVDVLPACYLVGGAAMLFGRRAQRLGDVAASTVVIRAARRLEPDLEALMAGKFNSLREHPHLEIRLRQRVQPAEAALALRALLRRDELDPLARVELFRELANRFRGIVEFPAEATEMLSDEQYVRDVVDIVFQRRISRPAAYPRS